MAPYTATVGLGYRRDMASWNMDAVGADFFEVAPENWLRRDRAPLHELLSRGKAVHLHGLTLNLGGLRPLDRSFVQHVGALMGELGTDIYSDHLAASGDHFQLHDLFPVPFTQAEVRRVGDRIRCVQDWLGRRIAIENPTWYANVGDLSEIEFLARVQEWADCDLLLDLNNLVVNHKNHGGDAPETQIGRLELKRVRYLHVAGHEFDARFGMFLDTHSQAVESRTVTWARALAKACDVPILLEWDNDIPDANTVQRELQCLRSSSM
jgi:uncharacterized protein